jgi:hypothetical protein
MSAWFEALVRRNALYKIISLGVAVLLYAIAVAQQGTRVTPRLATRDYTVTPALAAPPKDLVVTGVPPSLSVSVSGPPDLVRALPPGGPRRAH